MLVRVPLMMYSDVIPFAQVCGAMTSGFNTAEKVGLGYEPCVTAPARSQNAPTWVTATDGATLGSIMATGTGG